MTSLPRDLLMTSLMTSLSQWDFAARCFSGPSNDWRAVHGPRPVLLRAVRYTASTRSLLASCCCRSADRPLDCPRLTSVVCVCSISVAGVSPWALPACNRQLATARLPARRVETEPLADRATSLGTSRLHRAVCVPVRSSTAAELPCSFGQNHQTIK